MEMANINIYYQRKMSYPYPKPNNIDMNNYVKVCERKVHRIAGHTDDHILNAHFDLFNWQHSGFQPNDPEVGFNRNGADHTSMSVGDIVEIDGVKYLCEMVGWGKVVA